jgi:hypothetical protein
MEWLMQNEKNEATLEEWKELYDIASHFKKLECWNWMSDEEIFGVQNPETGEIGYCCIMGMLGQLRGMGVYLGDEGLHSYKTLLSITDDEDDASIFEKGLSQKFLMVSFESKNATLKEDKNIIKKLGLKFRGANGWTIFRDYSPGMMPWFLNREQVLYLRIAIRQAIDVILRFEEDEELLVPGKKGHYLVRVAQKNISDEMEWTDKWIKTKPYRKRIMEAPIIDMNRLQKIQNAGYLKTSIWEINSFLLSTPIVEKNDERPYYPNTTLWVDGATNMVLNLLITDKCKPDELLDKTLSLIENMKQIPDVILVSRPEYAEIFKPICAVLKITLKKVDKLKNFDNVKNEMFNNKRFR